MNWKLVIFLHPGPAPDFHLLLLVTGLCFFIFFFSSWGREVLISNPAFNPFDFSPAHQPFHDLGNSSIPVVQLYVLRLEKIGSPSYFTLPPTPSYAPGSDEHSVLIKTLLLSLFDNYFLLMLLRLLFLKNFPDRRFACHCLFNLSEHIYW